MPNIEIADTTSARLQTIAVPLVDTYDSVIVRLLDRWDATALEQPKILKPGQPVRIQQDGTMVFDPGNPPQLSFTTCIQILINGEALAESDTYWNNMMLAIIRLLHKDGLDAPAIHSMMKIANAEVGRKEINGYKYLPDVNLSVQGLDSSGSFRQSYQLAIMGRLSFHVLFKWQDNEKAAHRNHKGILEVG
ncbi:MAG: hypothetical protein ABI810_08375 [Sphingomonas bacterium]